MATVIKARPFSVVNVCKLSSFFGRHIRLLKCVSGLHVREGQSQTIHTGMGVRPRGQRALLPHRDPHFRLHQWGRRKPKSRNFLFVCFDCVRSNTPFSDGVLPRSSLQHVQRNETQRTMQDGHRHDVIRCKWSYRCQFHQHFTSRFSYKSVLQSFFLLSVWLCDFLLTEYRWKSCM